MKSRIGLIHDLPIERLGPYLLWQGGFSFQWELICWTTYYLRPRLTGLARPLVRGFTIWVGRHIFRRSHIPFTAVFAGVEWCLERLEPQIFHLHPSQCLEKSTSGTVDAVWLILLHPIGLDKSGPFGLELIA